MSNYKILDLYDHNIRSYEKIKNAFETDNVAAIIQATGTGKTYNALQLALDNQDKKMLYIVPYESIIEHIKDIINSNNNVSLKNEFKNIEFLTYQKITRYTDEEIKKLDLDILVLDEFHHIGAPVWGEFVNKIIESHKDIKILGMSAYTVRDRGTSYERDMVEEDGNELFSNKVVSNYNLSDAIVDGVLPKPIYRSAYVNLSKTIEFLDKKLEKINKNTELFKDLRKILDNYKDNMHNIPNMSDVFKNNIKKTGKYIYFCPFIFNEGTNDIDTIISNTKNWLYEMGMTDDDFVIYKTTSDMGLDGNKNRKAFLEDTDLDNNNVKNKLRIMFAINQYNEGVHVPNLDGVILGRSTNSDIVYFEHLGRALATKGDVIKRHYELLEKSYDELYSICIEKWEKLNSNLTKEELIELIESPIVIDLANNVDFIKELENDIKNKIKETINNNQENYGRKLGFINPSFNINMLNEEIYELLKYVEDRLAMTWNDYYELAKNYYNKYGTINDITCEYRTINGYEYDENGYRLGNWLINQRHLNKCGRLSEEKINQLNKLDIKWIKYLTWDEYYDLLKNYRKKYKNTYVPADYKTFDGYNYNENGFSLGCWFHKQRLNYDKYLKKHDMEKIYKLEDLDIDWNTENYVYLNNYFKSKVLYCKENNIDINNVTDDEILQDVVEYMEKNRRPFGFASIPTRKEIMGRQTTSFDDIDDMDEYYEMTDEFFDKQKTEDIYKALDTLSEKEKDVIIKRYGLEDGIVMTQEEIGKIYGVTSNRIHQIEGKALRKLRHPSRADYFRDYYNIPRDSLTYDERRIKKYKEKYNHEYDYLIDFITAPIEEQDKMEDTLCNYYLRIRKSDFVKICDKIMESRCHYWNSLDLSDVERIISLSKAYRDSSGDNFYKENGYTSMNERKKKGL